MVNLHVHDSMSMSGISGCSVKVDAPGISTLGYTQSMCSDTALSFESPTPHLQQVHIATHSTGSAPLRRSLLAPNVSQIRFLKLTTYSMADLANDDPPMVLPNIERLEIEELTPCGCHAAVAALMNLLGCCPALGELRLKFSWRNYLCATVQDPVIQAAVVSDFTPCRSINSDDGEYCCEGMDLLPELSCRCGLDCFRRSLRRVVLEFDTEELSCFQIQLVKLLACYAEDIVVDGGMGYDSSCIVRKAWRDGRGMVVVVWLGKKVIIVCATIVATQRTAIISYPFSCPQQMGSRWQ
ncbi:hypothetical protein D1007_47352 [Hordeum vulgare]|nr:hypothetical protein D1007_47352 [Hordeum vulgare]